MENKPHPIEMMLNPEKYGLRECPHCNGYGSSLKEPAPKCSQCGGLGLIKKNRSTHGQTTTG